MSGPPAPTSPTVPAARAASTWRGAVLRALAAALLTLALLVPLVLLDRPPAAPRLTFLGGGDGLSVLLEGVGGGRLLIGGGDARADIPAALGRRLRPWDRRIDLLIVTDRRDLVGATALVRRGDIRAVATIGLAGDRQTATLLEALRAACAARAVPLRAVAEAEHITVGRDAGLALDLLPPLVPDEGATVALAAGPLTAAIVGGAAPATGPVVSAILTHAGQEPFKAALAGAPSLVIAPAPPTTLDANAAPRGYLLVVGPGEHATIALEGERLRLRGPAPRSLAAAAPP